jgi:maltose/moltooligosaccharide transporter
MAAGLLWILDVGNNTAMEPIAFIADTLDEEQQPVGFQAQSFFYRFRSVLRIYPLEFSVNNCWLHRRITQLDVCLFIRAILSITSIWWSMSKTTEIPNS